MKKQMLKSALIALAGVGLMSGVALADPTGDQILAQMNSETDTPYYWINSDYFTLTDLTSGTNGSSDFTLTYEYAGWNSDFGIYSVATDGTVANTYTIFTAATEPTYHTIVYLHYDSVNSQWLVDNDNTWGVGDTVLSNIFGFFFKTYGDQTYTWYTDASLNTTDKGTDHIKVAYNGAGKMAFLLNDNPSGDADYNDMVTTGDDLLPIPEPTTMLLFGTGLLGLASVVRRKK